MDTLKGHKSKFMIVNGETFRNHLLWKKYIIQQYQK